MAHCSIQQAAHIKCITEQHTTDLSTQLGRNYQSQMSTHTIYTHTFPVKTSFK